MDGKLTCEQRHIMEAAARTARRHAYLMTGARSRADDALAIAIKRISPVAPFTTHLDLLRPLYGKRGSLPTVINR